MLDRHDIDEELKSLPDQTDLPADDPEIQETGESYLEDHPAALWDGDRGNLDAKQRDALVALLKKAFISSDDPVEWRTLTRDPVSIAINLNNLYLNLVIDEQSEVAYAAPARTPDNPFRTLVRDAPNNREETLLLIYLRERFRASTASGETHVFTDAIAMYEYVQRFRPESATDLAGDERRVGRAIEGLITNGILVKTNDEGRYRVHRAIEALLPLDRLNQLLEAFRRMRTDQSEDQLGIYAGKHAAHASDNATSVAAEDAMPEPLDPVRPDASEESA